MTNEIRCPSAAELISTWESGLGRPGHERALLLLELSVPGVTRTDLARWSIGRRDSLLFQLRRMLFGEGLNSIVRCPQCRVEVELNFTVSGIWRAEEHCCEDAGSIEIDGIRVAFRAPDSTDLEAASHMPSVDAARQCILDRCILEVAPCGRESLPAAIVDSVIETIAVRDGAADRRMSVVCQECGESWEEIFDIGVWLSQEIAAFVRRIVREVHALASAYGWREEDILAMTPTRRQLYIGILERASV